MASQAKTSDGQKRSRTRGRGEDSVYRREDGTWCGQVSLGYDASGKRIRKTVYGKTKKEVLQKIRELQQDAANGVPVKPENITLASFLDAWIIEQRDKVRPSTLAKYQYHIRHITSKHGIGHVKLPDLTYQQILLFYDRLEKEAKLGKRTIFDISTTLRAALTNAVKKKVIKENPALLVTRSKGDTEAAFMTHDQLRAVLRASNGERLHDPLVVLANTGLRPGEWLGLSWDDVDLENGILTVRQALHEHQDTDGKGTGLVVYLGPVKTQASRRTITLPRAAIESLKRWRRRQLEERIKAGPRWAESQNLIEKSVAAGFKAKTDIVFTNTVGGFMARTNIVKRDLRAILNKAAVLLAAERLGVDPEETLRLNARDIPTTTPLRPGYCIVLPDGRQAAIDAKDILERCLPPHLPPHPRVHADCCGRRH